LSFLSLDITDGEALRIDIRISKRARRLKLISGMRGVEAIVPINYDLVKLADFVASKRDWIIRTTKHYDKLKERCGELDLDTIYFLGDKYQFRIVKDRQQIVTISESMKLITFHVMDKRIHKRQIQEWYRQKTTSIIAERLPELSSKLKLEYNKVSIKKQRSRWGSCSRKKNLNFNLLLAAAPLEVIDYVIIHELIHLIELSHSKRFWELVCKADPEYEKHKKWLVDYAPVIKI
jgi:predicted metal-dependent hydrolase